MARYRFWWTFCIAAMAVLFASPAAGQNRRRPTLLKEWEVKAAPQVDLWYHGLAVIGFDSQEDFPLYNPDYISRVWDAKQELGIYPTQLDSLAEELRQAFSKDPAFQQLHFMPLYFPKVSREEMLHSLMAVARKRIKQEGVLNDSTSRGIQLASRTFQKGDQRKLLAKFVAALQNEWDVFYRDYWEQHFASDSGYYARIQQRWDAEVAPAIEPFLTKQRLQGGRIFVSPALGPEGRLFQGNVFRRTENAVAVWWPQWDDLDASLYSAVREMCFSVVDDAVVTARVKRSEVQKVSSKAAVRCGAMLLEQGDPEGFVEYRRSFLRAVGIEAEGAQLATAFEDAYQVDDNLVEAIRRHLAPPRPRTTAQAGKNNRVSARTDVGRALGATRRRQPTNRKVARTGWVVKAQPQTDLWFHSLAVIAADEPGPLGLYSADYAVKIREIKQARGIYPTMLDSLASKLRKQIAEMGDNNTLHFVPLYFPDVSPERMFEALEAVADGNARAPTFGRSDVRFGVFVMQQVMAKKRKLLRLLVRAMEDEWKVFFRDYWESGRAKRSAHNAEIQAMWDSVMVPHIGGFLERRRLSAGLIMPSPGLGPEGRIIDNDDFDPADQVVSVQEPPTTTRADATVFAFLKELCFLIINERVVGPPTGDPLTYEDLRRRTAVRCGALILEFYAPTLVPRYRRVFLDAVGAEESATQAAFERVYILDPKVFERLRQAIRGG
ncbi:MAG: hypothetical protein ACE5HT_00225 [Gemmatimonadales bacterium]